MLLGFDDRQTRQSCWEDHGDLAIARDFNGSTQYGQVSLNLSAFSKLTISFWMYPDSLSGAFNMILEHTADGLATVGGIAFYSSSGTTMNLTSNGGSGVAASIVSLPSTGSWHHIMLVIDFTRAGSELSYYLDGTSQSLSYVLNPDNASSATFANSTFNVAARNAASLHYDGKIAELAIYGGVDLGQAGADQLSKGFAPSCVAIGSGAHCVPLIGRTSPEIEVWNGNSLTLTNSPAQFDHPRIIYPGRRRGVDITAAAATTFTKIAGRGGLAGVGGVIVGPGGLAA